MGNILRVMLVAAFVSVSATGLPVFVDDELVSGELSSLQELQVVTIVAWPAPVVAREAARPWVSIADAGSGPACWFALALLLRELQRVHVLGRRARNEAIRSCA